MYWWMIDELKLTFPKAFLIYGTNSERGETVKPLWLIRSPITRSFQVLIEVNNFQNIITIIILTHRPIASSGVVEVAAETEIGMTMEVKVVDTKAGIIEAIPIIGQGSGIPEAVTWMEETGGTKGNAICGGHKFLIVKVVAQM